MIGNQRLRSFDKDFALLSHAPCRAEDRWSKGAIFNFHYTVVVKTLFLWLICSVRLGESETTVPPSEWIENPYVGKCSLASGPHSSLLSPSLIVGGGQLPNFRFFFVHFNSLAPPKFTEILEISTRSRSQKLYVTSYKFSSFFFDNKQVFKGYFTPNEKNPPFWLVFTLSKLIKDLTLLALRGDTMCPPQFKLEIKRWKNNLFYCCLCDNF